MPPPPPDRFAATDARDEVRRLARLAVPVAGTQFVFMLQGFVDTVMLGWYSVDAMASAISASVFVFSTMMFANGVLWGLDPVFAQAHGAGRGSEMGIALQRGVLLAGLLALPVALSWLAVGPLMIWTGQEPRLAPLAATYTLALLPGLAPLLVASVLRSWLQAREIVMPALLVITLANVLNALANWLLIFGRGGFPELGVLGAGLATSATRIFTLVGLLAVVVRWRLHVGAWSPWSRAALDWRGLRAITALGLPVAIQTSTEMWAFSASTLIAGTLGATAVAAHGLALNLASFSFMVPLGVAIGAATRVGNLLGAGHPLQAQRASWIAIAMGAGVMAVFAVAFVVLRTELPRLYTADAQVIALAATILPVAAAFQIFDGTQVVGCGVLRGMGRTRPAAVFNLIGYWVLGLPLGWMLGPGGSGGLVGLWWGLAFGLGVVALSLVAWIRRRGPATFRTGERLLA